VLILEENNRFITGFKFCPDCEKERKMRVDMVSGLVQCSVCFHIFIYEEITS